MELADLREAGNSLEKYINIWPHFALTCVGRLLSLNTVSQRKGRCFGIGSHKPAAR